MKFEEFVTGERQWLGGKGPQSEVVFSSRVRVARNLADHLFPSRATPTKKREILDLILSAIKTIPRFRHCTILKIEELTDIDKLLLVERYLISPELAAKKAGSAVVVDSKAVVTVMINEEDHIRMQALLSGLRVEKCWEIMNDIDDQLESQLGFAFSPQLGYLTACPTNVGTGIRVSAMLHLPGLILSKQIDKVLKAISKIPLTIRGFYGEGTEAFGNLFQISNQETLGKSEEKVIATLSGVVGQVIEVEKKARKALLKTDADVLYDRVGRSFGILRNAHVITSKEAIDLLSTLRMGIDLGIIGELDRQAVNELFVLTQPAHLQKINGRQLDAVARDIERGNLLRSRLSKDKTS